MRYHKDGLAMRLTRHLVSEKIDLLIKQDIVDANRMYKTETKCTAIPARTGNLSPCPSILCMFHLFESHIAHIIHQDCHLRSVCRLDQNTLSVDNALLRDPSLL